MAYKKCLIATTKNLFDIDSVSFFTKDSNGEYKSNKLINEADILWKPTDSAKQVTISGYIKCPVGKKYMFMITYTDGTEFYKNLESTGNYIYQAITSNSSKVISFIGFTYYDNSDQVYIKDVQIEYGSYATSYVPYGYLSSYKKIIKVNNNPVQLLDKSKYESSLTRNGITFTNNNDGTVTANGTATANADFGLFGSEYNYTEKLLDGKYLILGCPSNGGENSYKIYIQGNYESSYTPTATDTGSGAFMNYSSNSYPNRKFGCWIRISSGYTVNNLIFKPQLFNLTTMYGAGHEPTTVEQFRVKYPNDYYEYNPSQYLISYRKNLITDGSSKNLFDINNLTAYTPNNLPTTAAGVYNGNIIARAGYTQSQAFTGKTLKQLCPSIQAGKIYILSFKSNATSGGGQTLRLVASDRYWSNNSSLTLTENDLNSEVAFYANYPEFTIATISEFQIEEGNAATSYVPYQYL